MKDRKGSKAASQRGLRNGSKWLLYVTVAAVAMLLIPSFIIDTNDSSADAELPFQDGLYDENGGILTVPIFTDPHIPFDTETREDGTYYNVVAGYQIDCVPAFYEIRSNNNADHGRFKVTVGMSGLEGTWMDYCGVRVLASDGQKEFRADLTKAGQYTAFFFASEEEIANFENDMKYRISLETLGGSQSSTAPGPIENITVWFEFELIPDYSIVQFNAFGRIVEERILYEDDKVGELPELTISGYVFEGWFDSNDLQLTPDTRVYELAHVSEKLILVDAKYTDDGSWPKIIEWDDSPIHYPDGSVEYTHHKLTQYQDGSWTYEVSWYVLDRDGKEISKGYDEESFDPKEGQTEKSTETDITVHDDKSETWETHEETKLPDGRHIESDAVTEYDSEGTMVSEEKGVKITDPGQETREYEVEAKLIDEKEKKYRVEATIPDTTILDVDSASYLIEDYDYTIAVVGTHSDSGLIIVPEETMTVVNEKGYYISVSNGEQYVAIDNDVVDNLTKLGGEVRLLVQKATDDMLTPSQKEVIGDNYAVSVTLTANGEVVTDLKGYAEVVIDPGYKSVSVYSVMEDGSTAPCSCTYDPVTGKVKFTAAHLSVFFIEKEKETNDNSFAIPFIVIALAEMAFIFIVGYAVVARWRRRHGNE